MSPHSNSIKLHCGWCQRYYARLPFFAPEQKPSYYTDFRYVNIWHTSAATFRLMRWTRTEGLRGLSQSRANAANLRSLASALTSHTRMVPDSSYELVVHFIRSCLLASPLWLSIFSRLISTFYKYFSFTINQSYTHKQVVISSSRTGSMLQSFGAVKWGSGV